MIQCVMACERPFSLSSILGRGLAYQVVTESVARGEREGEHGDESRLIVSFGQAKVAPAIEGVLSILKRLSMLKFFQEIFHPKRNFPQPTSTFSCEPHLSQLES